MGRRSGEEGVSEGVEKKEREKKEKKRGGQQFDPHHLYLPHLQDPTASQAKLQLTDPCSPCH